MASRNHIGIYAGSFDPLTLGHLDVIARAARIVDELIIAVARNTSKSALFTPEEKLALLRETTHEIPNLSVEYFDGLLVSHARARGARALVRGIRTVTDFEYEFPMALTNRQMAPEIETLFLMTDGAYAHLSSSLIKEIVRMGGSVKGMVPEQVEAALIAKLRSQP